jgi:hypothetical protein
MHKKAPSQTEISVTIHQQQPTPAFEDEFREWVRRTGCPEDFPGLHPGPILKTEPFIKLVPIEVEKAKRVGRGKIPCAMCQPDKFYSGSLVYLPHLRATAIIGHCCADKENAAEANREYKVRKTKEREENYLLEKIPFVPQALAAIRQARPAAQEASHVYRHFRKNGAEFFNPLKLINKAGGNLTVEEVVRTNQVGPAGYRSRGSKNDVRTISFGVLDGGICFLSDYNPVRELDAVERNLKRHACGKDPNSALDYIVTLKDNDRHAAYVELTEAHRGFLKFRGRLADFFAFFEGANIERVNRWGVHPANTNGFSASLVRRKSWLQLEMRGRTSFVAVLKPDLWLLKEPWPDLE